MLTFGHHQSNTIFHEITKKNSAIIIPLSPTLFFDSIIPAGRYFLQRLDLMMLTHISNETLSNFSPCFSFHAA